MKCDLIDHCSMLTNTESTYIIFLEISIIAFKIYEVHRVDEVSISHIHFWSLSHLILKNVIKYLLNILKIAVYDHYIT